MALQYACFRWVSVFLFFLFITGSTFAQGNPPVELTAILGSKALFCRLQAGTPGEIIKLKAGVEKDANQKKLLKKAKKQIKALQKKKKAEGLTKKEKKKLKSAKQRRKGIKNCLSLVGSTGDDDDDDASGDDDDDDDNGSSGDDDDDDNGSSGDDDDDDSTPACGDGICDAGEDSCTCEADCASVCGDECVSGDEICEIGDTISCTVPGGYAGTRTCNGTCNGFGSCIPSEFCGDGIQNGSEECDGSDDSACPGVCESNCRCGEAAVCGDGICEPPENETNCAADCSAPDATPVWYPVTIDFSGPNSSESDNGGATSSSPNPFLHYRLQVEFTGPSGQVYDVPGFYAGNGSGGGSGQIWRVIFSPDEAGTWTYLARFRKGNNVAVSLNPSAGVPDSFNGETDTLLVSALDPAAPGFYRYGKLQHVGQHHLKFKDGPFFIKGGTDSPENFLGYQGFDGTSDQGGLPSGENFLHAYTNHISDWQPGDPDWNSGAGKGIIGALNYLSSKNVNSIYFLPMNLGGDGQETWPFVGPANTVFNKTHYDISKLEQWKTVLEHATRKGILLHFVLAETESANENWLDGGNLGTERKLYYRELIARFGYNLAIKWNLCEENDYSVSKLEQFADFIQAVDPYDHPIAVHTHTDNFSDYFQIVGDPRFSATSIQYNVNSGGQFVQDWRTNSANAGHKWIVDMDENTTGLTSSNIEQLRKQLLYDVLFSGGNIEWYYGYHSLPLGGDIRAEDFSTREAMWNYMWYARKFLEENVPFWDMVPADGLLTGESGSNGGAEVFAKAGVSYAIYLPDASPSGTLNLTGDSGSFIKQWYDPRTGVFAGTPTAVSGGGNHALGAPPYSSNSDWVVLLSNYSSSDPLASISASDLTPLTGEEVTFDGTGSIASQGETIVLYEWDLNDDGNTDATGPIATHTFLDTGDHDVTLTVTDSSTASDSATETVNVLDGNSGLSGTYFDNPDLTGPVLTTVDPEINFSWGGTVPHSELTDDASFSVRWLGYLQVDTPGSYTLYTQSNDGIRLRVNGGLLIDNWTQHAVTEDSATVSLSAGSHTVSLEYFQNGGSATIVLLWQGPGISKQVIPASNLSTTN